MRDVNILMMSVDAYPKRGGVAQFAHHCAAVIQNLANQAVFVGPKTYTAGLENCHEITDSSSKEALQAGRGYLDEMHRIRSMLHQIVEQHKINRILLFHPFYYGRPAVDVASELGIPCESVVHGTELTSQFPELVDGPDLLAPKPVNSRNFHLLYTLSKLDRVHANSEYTAEICRTISGRDNVAVCGCGIASQDIANLNQKSQEQPRQNLTLRLCFIGRLVRHKFIDRIFPLLKHVDAKLDIIGTGPERETLEALAASESVSNNVVFHGDLDDDAKWSLLSASDFLMLPSDYDPKTLGYEGFGIVLLEAIAAGTIPVCSAQQGAKDPIEDYKIGLKGLAPDQPLEETAELLKRYSQQDAYAAKLAADKDVLLNKLLWEHVVERISKDW